MKLFKLMERYVKDNGVSVELYEPNFPVYIESIDRQTGRVHLSRVSKYTRHFNLSMFRFKYKGKSKQLDFFASSDHSLLVYGRKADSILTLSPTLLRAYLSKISADELFFIRYNKKGDARFKLGKVGRNIVEYCTLVPVSMYDISYDPSVTEAGDFTVEGDYTFRLSNGIFVMDSMAVYTPMLSGSIKEAEEKLSLKANLFSPANRESLIDFKHEITLGFVHLIRDGRHDLIKDILPVEMSDKVDSLQNYKSITHSFINNFVSDILSLKFYSVEEKLKFVDDLYRLCINYVSESISLDEFFIPDLPDIRYSSSEDNAAREILEDFKSKNFNGSISNSVFDIIVSGSRGNWEQFRQISIGKGYIADVFGKILSDPVNTSLLEGLDKDEYFRAAYGSRKGIIDTSANTSLSGYETRKLVFLLSSVRLDPELDDCKTDKYLELFVENEAIAERLVGRFYKSNNNLEKITVENYKDLIGKTIKLRSPVFCKAKDGYICHKCYGDLFKIHNSKQIGIIAAQSLGERMTQLVLRTFHLGGIASESVELDIDTDKLVIDSDMLVALDSGFVQVKNDILLFSFEDGSESSIKISKKMYQINKDDLIQLSKNEYEFESGSCVLYLSQKNKDIISDLSVIKRYFNAYMGNISIEEFVLGLHNIFSRYGKIDLIHYEVLASMLVVGQNDNIIYRYSSDDDFIWIGLQKSLDLHSGILHNLAFERFSGKLHQYLKGNSNVSSFLSLTEQLLLNVFDDRPIQEE